MLDNTVLVSSTIEYSDSAPSDASKMKVTYQSALRWGENSRSVSKTKASCSSGIRTAFSSYELPKNTEELIKASWGPTTLARYESILRR